MVSTPSPKIQSGVSKVLFSVCPGCVLVHGVCEDLQKVSMKRASVGLVELTLVVPAQLLIRHCLWASSPLQYLVYCIVTSFVCLSTTLRDLWEYRGCVLLIFIPSA